MTGGGEFITLSRHHAPKACGDEHAGTRVSRDGVNRIPRLNKFIFISLDKRRFTRIRTTDISTILENMKAITSPPAKVN
ncbi:hypothetical protein ET1_05_01390 [Edwardsiella tarda ATCC 15947 = NBRC 105688]|nr:hypothetical protein ET1_05_01390 [Edwardsiella tarda ATCC 15947 = NBRC 105688]